MLSITKVAKETGQDEPSLRSYLLETVKAYVLDRPCIAHMPRITFPWCGFDPVSIAPMSIAIGVSGRELPPHLIVIVIIGDQPLHLVLNAG